MQSSSPAAPRDLPPVSRGTILSRGLRHRCPNCGSPKAFHGLFKVEDRCPVCGFLILREEGFFVGAMALNFFAATVPMVIVFVLLFLERISVPLAVAILVAWGVLVPILFYQTSKSLWLTLFYVTHPQHLPANHRSGQVYQERL